MQDVARHPGFTRLFAPGKLTIGLILPLETHPRRPRPTMQGHVEMAQQADALGFGALWVRDIPFYEPAYGDVGQVFEPLAYAAHLAAKTRVIALGTAGIVLPLREPLLLAKQVATVDLLSGGRFVLGVSSGDRPSDYPLFGIDAEERGERLREVFGVYRAVAEHSFPTFQSEHFGRAQGQLDLVPKPPFGSTPTLAVGRAQQALEWIAANMHGFMAYAPLAEGLPLLAQEWSSQVSEVAAGPLRPLAVGGFLDLVPDAHHPVVRIPGGLRAGVRSLVQYLDSAQHSGIQHFAMNLRVSERPYMELMMELSEHVLPRFPSHTMADPYPGIERHLRPVPAAESA